MENSRKIEELRPLRNKLEKLCTNENPMGVADEFEDILKILERETLTPDMIQPSRSGLGFGPLTRKFVDLLEASSPIRERGLTLLKHWKEMIKSGNIKSLEEMKNGSSIVAEVKKSVAPVIVSSGKNSINSRRAAKTVLQTAFKDVAPAKSEKVVAAIEAALDAVYFDKEYSSKYRSITANLKKNKFLFQNIIDGAISPQKLIKMTPAELASEEIRVSREKILLEQASGRSMNWADENREKIHELLGIDSNNTWEYDDEEDGLSEPDIETGEA